MSIKSLFVVGLPCSLSTLIYHASRLALGLNEPVWTTDGEVLNVDRFAMTPKSFDHAGVKYLRKTSDPNRFGQVLEFAHHCTAADGFAYKDVVHPFVISEFLKNKQIPTLFIDRPIVDVADAMISKGWLYPCTPNHQDIELSIISGLSDARQVLIESHAQPISFDDAISNESHLCDVLKKLYPYINVPSVRYIDDTFKCRTTIVLRRRKTAQYLRLLRKINNKNT